MLRVDRNSKTLTKLSQRELPGAGLRERDDIQRMIRTSPDDFFGEMGEELLLVAEEVRPSEAVDDRIDLLAIDGQGSAVVIELKRRDHKLHLLQALSYAAMVSGWEPERFVEERSRLMTKPRSEAQDDIDQYLLDDFAKLNQRQRIILIAEGFDWEVLRTAEWLSEKHDVDIRCYRLRLAVDGGTEYLSCTCVFPPPELTAQAARRRRVEKQPARWTSWDAALADLENPAVAEFFQEELKAGTESYLRKRILHFRIKARRAFFVAVRQKNAYVWQQGRFPQDEEFWTSRLGSGADPKPVRDRTRLRFFLESPEQFAAFRKALEQDLATAQFVDRSESDDIEEDDPSEGT